MSTLQEKSMISLSSAVLFALVNLPITYSLTNAVLPVKTFNVSTQCPTHLGLLIHTLVFFAVTYFSMGVNNRMSQGMKLRNSIFSALIFYLVSSPMMYSVVASVFGSRFASQTGCQTLFGVLFHAVVYFLILVAVMYLP